MLLAELYEKGRNVLDQGALKRPFEERAHRRRQEVREFLDGEPRATADLFLSRVDDRYLLATPDGRFVEHCRTLAAFDGRRPSSWRPIRRDRGPRSSSSSAPMSEASSQRSRTLSANTMNILTARSRPQWTPWRWTRSTPIISASPCGGPEEAARHRGPFARSPGGDHGGGAHGRASGGEYVRDRVPGTGPPASSSTTRSPRASRGGHLHLRPDRAPLRHHEHADGAWDRHRALQDLHESGPGGRRLLHRGPGRAEDLDHRTPGGDPSGAPRVHRA